jgi:cupin 2 domain-containing protein
MNLFSNLPQADIEERIESLLARGNVRIERITSQGQASPEGFWYEQEQHEWVALLRGAARLNVSGKVVNLGPGDTVDLPAGCRHRIEWTTTEEPTVWLAVFYG